MSISIRRSYKLMAAIGVFALLLGVPAPIASSHTVYHGYGSSFTCVKSMAYASQADGFVYAETESTANQYGDNCIEPYVAIYRDALRWEGGCLGGTRVAWSARPSGKAATHWYASSNPGDICTYHSAWSQNPNNGSLEFHYTIAHDVHHHF